MIGASTGLLEPEFVRSVVTDPDRLAELRATGLLDIGAEEPFDRITRLAEQMLRVDSARLTLVDRDRQYFKSRSDATRQNPELHETPLSHSFCQYAVASRARFVVEDARHHPQVRENPAIADHGIVAYAGEALETASGHVLGTLCVVSTEPREWTDAELDLLSDLAHLALTEIEYRLRSRALQRLADVAAQLHAPADALSDAVLRLATEAEGSDQPVVGRLAVAARSRMQKLRSVVDELDELILWRPDLVEQIHRPVALGERLMRAASAAAASVGDRSLRTEIRDRPLTVQCDPLAVERALTNLLVGAMQHAAADVPVELAMHRAGDDVQLHLDSDGRAMPVSELTRLVGQLHSALTDPESRTVGASVHASGRTVRIGHGPVTATTGPEGTHLSFSVPYVTAASVAGSQASESYVPESSADSPMPQASVAERPDLFDDPPLEWYTKSTVVGLAPWSAPVFDAPVFDAPDAFAPDVFAPDGVAADAVDLDEIAPEAIARDDVPLDEIALDVTWGDTAAEVTSPADAHRAVELIDTTADAASGGGDDLWMAHPPVPSASVRVPVVTYDMPAGLSDPRAMHVVIDAESFAKAFAAALAPVLESRSEAPDHTPHASPRCIYVPRMVDAGVMVRSARKRARMSARDLADASGVSPSTVTRIERGEMNPTVTMLERLLDAAGNRLDVVVTPHPIRPTLGALQSRRQEIIKIVESFGASNVRVVGSVARGEARDDSDIDLLIDVPAGTGLITIERITDALEDVIPWRVDVVTTGAVRGRMADVIDDAVAL